MADSGQAVEGLEKRAPFLAQWGKLAAAGGREAIVAAVASSFVRLPVGFYPSTLFHFVEQRVERGERELESAVGALANLLGNFESVERLLSEQGGLTSSRQPGGRRRYVTSVVACALFLMHISSRLNN